MGLLSWLIGDGEAEDTTDYNTLESLHRPQQADGIYTADFRARAEHDARQASITHVWKGGWIPIDEYKRGRNGKMG